MSDFTKATEAGTDRAAELGARKMVYAYVGVGLVLLALSIGGIYAHLRSNQFVASLGLIVLVVVSVGFLCRAEELGENAERVSDRAIAWRHGAVSAEGVGGLLESLPDVYHVYDGFVTRKGKTDHIVVGPKGLLTIYTPDHRGVVTQDRGTLLLDGVPMKEDVIKQAWRQSYAVRDLLAEKGVCTLRPRPVIVFTEAEVRLKDRVRGVPVIGIEGLQAFLEGLPVWLSGRLSKAINACLWATRNC